MVWYYLSSLGFVATDFFALNLIPAVAGMQDSTATQELVRTLIVTAVWVPYMSRSRRVKNTFAQRSTADIERFSPPESAAQQGNEADRLPL